MKKILLTVFIGLTTAMIHADSQSEIFNRTTEHLDKGGIYFQYQNLENLSSQILTIIETAENSLPQNPSHKRVLSSLTQFINVLNLNDIQSAGLSIKRLSPTLYANKSFLTVKQGNNNLLFALDNQQNHSFTLPSLLPENTIFAAGSYLDWNNLYKKLELAAPDKEQFKVYCSMFEQSLQFKLKDMAANISGEFFAGIFKGRQMHRYHFMIIIPDRNGMLENLCRKYFGAMIQNIKNNKIRITLPLAESDFGNGITLESRNGCIAIFNSDFKDVNFSVKAKKLSAVNPAIFKSLNKTTGTSYLVCNFDPSWLDSTIRSCSYMYCGTIKYTPYGYAGESISNFNLNNFAEYAPLLKLLPEKIKKNTVTDTTSIQKKYKN